MATFQHARLIRATFQHAWGGREKLGMHAPVYGSHMRGADSGGKLASTQIITCIHTYTVTEWRRSGTKIRSATNGSNTQFSASASKPHAPNHLCPQEMADPPTSAPRMCEHTRGRGAEMSKSAHLRSATILRICERSFKYWCCYKPLCQGLLSFQMKVVQPLVDLLWPSDTIWCHATWSTLVKVMALCLMALSHYLNQCWPIITFISEVLWHSALTCACNVQDIYPEHEFENHQRLQLHLPGVNEFRGLWCFKAGLCDILHWCSSDQKIWTMIWDW